MKKNLFVGWLLVACFVFSNQTWASGAARCVNTHRLAVVEKIINTNARTEAAEYSRPHQRNLLDYKNFLGETARKFLEAAGPGTVWIDSGGGFGIAAAQAVLKKGFVSFVINAQDFWGHFEKKSEMPDELRSFAEDLEVSFDGFPVREVRQDGALTYVVKWSFLTRQHYQIVKQRVLDTYHSLVGSGRFHYLQGFSEIMLLKIQTKANFISDLYGAFLYSDGRAALLDLYFEKLADSGLAVIRYQTRPGKRHDAIGVVDRVRRKDGRSQLLTDYLVEKFPTVFSFDRQDHAVLVMQKDPTITKLGISESIQPDPSVKTKILYRHGIDYPNVSWIEI